LAHLLQRLTGVFATAALAAAGGFSHATHLKLKPQCTSCHTRAAASTKLEDNLLPEKQACAPCHKDITIARPRPARLAKFDHAFHLKFGNIAPLLKGSIQSNSYLGQPEAVAPHLETKNACAGCHHGIEQSAALSKTHFPQMADCLVCHSKIDAPYSCETCHGKDKTLKPAFHTADYLDAHTRRSVKQGCAVCHGRQFTCLGCH
jgi:hypothetical protein